MGRQAPGVARVPEDLRHQDDAAGRLGRSGVREHVPRRGAGRGAHPPPQRGRDHRPRRAGRGPLPGDGVGRGREPRLAGQGGARARRRAHAHHPPHRLAGVRRASTPRTSCATTTATCSTWSTATSRRPTCSCRRAASSRSSTSASPSPRGGSTSRASAAWSRARPRTSRRSSSASSRVDRRSDIFSFGVLLYVLATGLHPFRGETDTKTIENIALREPVPLRAHRRHHAARVRGVVLKALAKEPQGSLRHRRRDAARARSGRRPRSASPPPRRTSPPSCARRSGETLTKRAQDLRAAIERADGRTPSPPSGDAGRARQAGGEADGERGGRDGAAAADHVGRGRARERQGRGRRDLRQGTRDQRRGRREGHRRGGLLRGRRRRGCPSSASICSPGRSSPRPRRCRRSSLPRAKSTGPREATSPPVTRSASEADTDDVPVDTGLPPSASPW